MFLVVAERLPGSFLERTLHQQYECFGRDRVIFFRYSTRRGHSAHSNVVSLPHQHSERGNPITCYYTSVSFHYVIHILTALMKAATVPSSIISVPHLHTNSVGEGGHSTHQYRILAS